MDSESPSPSLPGKRLNPLETWLRTGGVARYDAYKRDPIGQAAEDVFERLRQHHRLHLAGKI